MLVSAILYGGRPELVLKHVLTRQVFVTSDYIIGELVDYLKDIRPKAPQKWVRTLGQKLEAHSHDVAGDDVAPVRDINDTDIVRLAVAQLAIVVTGDRDLLEYKAQSQVAILSVAEYLELWLEDES